MAANHRYHDIRIAMLTIKELSEHFDKSRRSITRRLNALGIDKRGCGDDYVRRGKRGQYVVTDNGVSLLQRLIELENEGYQIHDAAEKIQKEVNLTVESAAPGGDDPLTAQQVTDRGDSKPAPITGELLTYLERQFDLLQKQLEEKDYQLRKKDDQIDRLQDIIQNRLPGRTDQPENPKRHSRSFLQRVRNWLTEEV